MNNEVVCNICGAKFDFWDKQEEFQIKSGCIGYGSKYDGCSLKLNLCCKCTDWLIDLCKISPTNDIILD